MNTDEETEKAMSYAKVKSTVALETKNGTDDSSWHISVYPRLSAVRSLLTCERLKLRRNNRPPQTTH